MPTLKVNGVNLSYELHGRGQPLVFISDFTINHRVWLHLLDELTSHFQILIFDNRGTGASDQLDEPFTANTMAQATFALPWALEMFNQILFDFFKLESLHE